MVLEAEPGAAEGIQAERLLARQQVLRSTSWLARDQLAGDVPVQRLEAVVGRRPHRVGACPERHTGLQNRPEGRRVAQLLLAPGVQDAGADAAQTALDQQANAECSGAPDVALGDRLGV